MRMNNWLLQLEGYNWCFIALFLVTHLVGQATWEL